MPQVQQVDSGVHYLVLADLNSTRLKYIFRRVDTSGHNFYAKCSSWPVVSEAHLLLHVEGTGLCLVIESLHIDPGALHQQLSKVLVSAFTDPQ